MVEEVEFDWDACDSSEAKETVVLLGAGASADAGLPTATGLHEQLAERLGPLYRNLASLVFAQNETVDVERLFRVIQFVHAMETGERDDERRLVDAEAIDIARLVERWQPMLHEYLEAQRHTVAGTPTGQLIDALWDALFHLLWLPPRKLSSVLRHDLAISSARRFRWTVR